MQQLKASLLGVLGSNPERDDVKQFVTICHRMALAYVRSRLRTGGLNRNFLPPDVDRFALDLIADLFERDEHGRFVELRTYFGRIEVRDAEIHALRAATRRLVFSQVHDGLFRHLTSRDPSLGKIVRNLKRTVKMTDGVILQRQGRQLWIRLHSEDTPDARPVMTDDFLERRLSAWMNTAASLRSLVERLASLLCRESYFRPAYPLTSLAISIRKVKIRRTVEEPSEPFVPPQPMISALKLDEIAGAVEGAVLRTSRRLESSYVDRKMDSETYRNYFSVVEDVIRAEFMPHVGNGRSRRHFLSRHFGEVTPEEYNREHRGVLDYFIRLSREDFLDIARRAI